MEQFLQKKFHIQKTIKGSRFLGYAFPCSSKEEIEHAREELRKSHSGANHHCYAWRLATGEEGFSDDGEPKSSAGMPILKRLVSQSCVDTLIVVVRYFGGTKLGIGGLVRAYGGVAHALLEEGTLVPYQRYVLLAFSCGYEILSIVEHVLSSYTHLICTRDFLEDITFEVQVLESEQKEIQQMMHTRTRGKITNMRRIP